MSGEPEAAASSCYLDERTFQLCCQLLLQHSSALNDGWVWVRVKGTEEGYIKKTVVVAGRAPAAAEQHAGGEEVRDADALTEDAEVEDGDAAAAGRAGDQAVMQYEYHALYSCSYQTPVLYFQASTLDGRPLSLEEVWDNVHPHFKSRLLQRPWDALTQQEHPLLGQPFFMLHPCHTEHFMRPALQAACSEKKRVNYVVAWLSVVGPVVGLHVPLSYSGVPAPD